MIYRRLYKNIKPLLYSFLSILIVILHFWVFEYLIIWRTKYTILSENNLANLIKATDDFKYGILEHHWVKYWKELNTSVNAALLMKITNNDALCLYLEHLNTETKRYYFNLKDHASPPSLKNLTVKVLVQIKNKQLLNYWKHVKAAIEYYKIFEVDIIEEYITPLDLLIHYSSYKQLNMFIREDTWVNFDELYATINYLYVNEGPFKVSQSIIKHSNEFMDLSTGFILTLSAIEEMKIAMKSTNPSKNITWYTLLEHIKASTDIKFEPLYGLNSIGPLESIRSLFHRFYMNRDLRRSCGILYNSTFSYEIAHRYRTPITFGNIHTLPEMYQCTEKYSPTFYDRLNLEKDFTHQDIPAIIHQIWIGNLPDNTKIFMDHCKNTHIQDNSIHWEYKFWGISELRQELGDEISDIFLYNGYKHQSLLKFVDIARLYILFKYGGIYLDSDTLCLSPLNTVINLHESGSNATMPRKEGFGCWESMYHQGILIANGAVGFTPYSKFIYILLHHIFFRLSTFTKTIEESTQAWMITGPLPFSFIYSHFPSWTQNKASLNILPYWAFYPDHHRNNLSTYEQWKYVQWKKSLAAQLWSSTKDYTNLELCLILQNLEDLNKCTTTTLLDEGYL